MTRRDPPRLLAKTASELPSGERDVAPHAVAQRQVLRQQVLELGRAALVRLRSMRRFWASKRTTSTSFLTVENAATRSPDGDAIGESSWLPPPPESASVRNGRPKSLGSPVSTSCGRCSGAANA